MTRTYREDKEGRDAGALVGEAPEPGIKTYLDLPMITGCMGTHETAR